MALKHTMTVPFSVDAVGDLLCSERYCEDSQGKRDDVVAFRFEEKGETDTERRFEVQLETYGRTKTGKVNKSKTELSTIRSRFDKTTNTLHWNRHGNQGEKVTVGGTTQLTASGNGTRVDREATIKIRIPLIGRAIEKLVEHEMKKGWANSADQITHLLSHQ